MEFYNSRYSDFESFFRRGDSLIYRKQQELIMEDIHFITNGNEGFLICAKNGTSLLLDKYSAQSFRQGEISDYLAYVMVQRGMASFHNSRPIIDASNTICPSLFLIDMTKSCNLNCIYCFRKISRKSQEINSAQLKFVTQALINYMKSHPGLRVTIQPWGGEPLLKFDLILMMRRLFDEASLHPEIIIETNGTLINMEIAQAINSHNIHVGISIDGNALVHDLQRPMLNGNPSLIMVKNGIQNLRKVGIQFGVITVVTQNTLANLDAIINYYAYDLKLNCIKLNLMRKTNLNRNLAIDSEEINSYSEKLLNCLYKLYKEGVHIIEQNVRQRILNLTCRPDNTICNACGCQGGYRMLSVDPEGDVYPCELTDYPEFKMGSISEPIDAIVERAVKRKKGYFELRREDKCVDCPWLYFCRGGCKTAALYNYGSISFIDETECLLNKSLYPKLVQILLNDSMFAEYLRSGYTSREGHGVR